MADMLESLPLLLIPKRRLLVKLLGQVIDTVIAGRPLFGSTRVNFAVAGLIQVAVLKWLRWVNQLLCASGDRI